MKPHPHKYGAKATVCNKGHNHPSRREAKRCGELQLLEKAGAIAGLQYEPQYWFQINGQQVVHPNGRRVGYKPDFYYVEHGRMIVEDVKSKATMTEAAVLRMTIFRALNPDIDLRVLT